MFALLVSVTVTAMIVFAYAAGKTIHYNQGYRDSNQELSHYVIESLTTVDKCLSDGLPRSATIMLREVIDDLRANYDR